jgi:HEAT repeat protein
MPYGWLHREPFYRGFPASYWKSELRDPGVHTGSATVDALLRRVLPLRTRDQVAMELARGGRRAVQVLIAALEDADEDTREGAARAILSMPPRQVQSAVASLVRAARHLPGPPMSPSARAASEALIRIGADATVFDLVAAARDSDGAIRRGAIEVLEEFGPDAHAAVPFLVEALRNSDRGIRNDAYQALRCIDPYAVPHDYYTFYRPSLPRRRTQPQTATNPLGLPITAERNAPATEPSLR